MGGLADEEALSSLCGQGDKKFEEHRYEDAKTIYSNALRIHGNLMSIDQLVDLYELISSCCARLNQYDKAVECDRECLARLERRPGYKTGDEATIRARDSLADDLYEVSGHESLSSKQELTEAAGLLRMNIELRSDGKSSPQANWKSQNRLAAVLARLHEYVDAQELYKKILESASCEGVARDTVIIDARHGYASIIYRMRRFSDAKKLFETNLKAIKSLTGEEKEIVENVAQETEVYLKKLKTLRKSQKASKAAHALLNDTGSKASTSPAHTPTTESSSPSSQNRATNPIAIPQTRKKESTPAKDQATNLVAPQLAMSASSMPESGKGIAKTNDDFLAAKSQIVQSHKDLSREEQPRLSQDRRKRQNEHTSGSTDQALKTPQTPPAKTINDKEFLVAKSQIMKSYNDLCRELQQRSSQNRGRKQVEQKSDSTGKNDTSNLGQISRPSTTPNTQKPALVSKSKRTPGPKSSGGLTPAHVAPSDTETTSGGDRVSSHGPGTGLSLSEKNAAVSPVRRNVEPRPASQQNDKTPSSVQNPIFHSSVQGSLAPAKDSDAMTEAGGDLYEGQSTSQGFERWMKNVRKYTHRLLDQSVAPNPGRQRVRVAILDSGINLARPGDAHEDANKWLKKRSARCVKYKDFTGANAEWVDSKRDFHGTRCAALLMQMAPEADIYIANIVHPRVRGQKSEHVVAALKWAIDEKVDIISMSFGWDQVKRDVDVQIDRARQRGILLFAAASNDADFAPEYGPFPAFQPTVFCVYSCKATGDRSAFNPRPSKHKINFMLPGEDIAVFDRDMRPLPGFDSIKGTSFATPIAAGTAALVLELLRLQKQDHDKVEPDLKRYEGMAAVFGKMSGDPTSDGYYHVRPWSLLGLKDPQRVFSGDTRLQYALARVLECLERYEPYG